MSSQEKNKNFRIPVKEVKTWNEFEKIVNKMRFRDWVFRGQSDAEWGLESTLTRQFKTINTIYKESSEQNRKFNKLVYEQRILEKFRANAHLYLSWLPDKDYSVEFLSIMQHYGAATRLLDVTFSPYIAAYFALEEKSVDCAVYCFKRTFFQNENKKQKKMNFPFQRLMEVNFKKKDYLFSYEPERSNERLQVQQGLFLVLNSLEKSFEKVISNYKNYKEASLKLIIPGMLRYHGLKKLNKMNINRLTLFPGLDGFCRSLNFLPLDSISRIKISNG